MNPSFQESLISQLPAIRLLQQLGYVYLSPEEVAVQRQGRRGRVLLEEILTGQLRRLNRIQFRGKEAVFSEENITRAVEALRDVPYQGLVRTSEQVYDLLTLGKSLDQAVDGESKGFTLRYVDWENPRNNVFHVTAEFEVDRSGSRETRRPDIVCFVNGIPFVVIECKRPDGRDSLEQAVNQQIRNGQDDEIPQLFIHAQLLLALNKNEAKYATAGTPPKFWATWREHHDMTDEVRAAVNQPLPPEEHGRLFQGIFAFAREAMEAQATEPREPTAQDRLLWSLCRPERLIELVRQFILYDEGGTVKKIARYQQYFAIQATLERVRQRDVTGRRKGGVIWQTQGSGKSLAMVLLGKALAMDRSIQNARVVIVTDRIDLDEQITKTFHQCGKDPKQARTGAHLVELLRDERVGVITTVLFKFEAAAKAAKELVRLSDDLFVLVDESHRSQYGEANIKMQRALPGACFIGFTGTPLMKKEKSTAERFGGFIEPAYTIRDAVDDQAVVPLLYEGRHILQDVNAKPVDRMFDDLCEGLSSEQKADLKRKFAARDELNRLHSRLYLIAHDVSRHFSAQWKGTGFKGQLTAPGKKEALLLKGYFDQFGKVSTEVIISGPTEIENPEEHAQPERDESVELFWKAMMAKYGTEKEYNRRIIDAFKKGDEPEIIIVVDKLLTGFDAPRNVVLYIARSLKDHTLLQAIARVNRLHPGKDYGTIVDYYGVVAELHSALELYSDLAGKFDKEDLEGTLTHIAEEVKKLPERHDALWDLFKAVKNKKDEESFEVALEAKAVREDFYTRLWQFCRALKLAASSIQWVRDTPPEQARRYKEDAAFFQKLRASVKRRYAEEVDYRDYEKQIQKLLNTYVQAEEVIQVVAPVNIFEREAFAKEVERAGSDRAKADTIANRTKRTTTERMEEDPFFYRRLSALLQQAIDDYRAQRISEADYLAKVTAVMEQTRGGNQSQVPEALRQNELSRALFGALKEQLVVPPAPASPPTGGMVREESAPYGKPMSRPGSPADELLAEAALAMDEIIRKHAVVRWRENVDAQNRMRNDLDDFLFDLQKRKGITLSFTQMDAILESVIRIALHRTDDV